MAQLLLAVVIFLGCSTNFGTFKHASILTESKPCTIVSHNLSIPNPRTTIWRLCLRSWRCVGLLTAMCKFSRWPHQNFAHSMGAFSCAENYAGCRRNLFVAQRGHGVGAGQQQLFDGNYSNDTPQYLEVLPDRRRAAHRASATLRAAGRVGACAAKH